MNALDDSVNTDRCTLYEDSANFLKDERFTKLWQNIRPQQTFERWTPRTQESPHELARQSEAKRKQAPQSEANVSTTTKKPPLLIAQDTQYCTEHPTQIRGWVLVPRTQKKQSLGAPGTYERLALKFSLLHRMAIILS